MEKKRAGSKLDTTAGRAWMVAVCLAIPGCTADDSVGGAADASVDVPVLPGVDASIDVAHGSSDASRDSTTPDTSVEDAADDTTPNVDAGTDVAAEAESGAADAGSDTALPDAGTDAGVDAGIDAGVDAGIDAGVDAGIDAGGTTLLGPTAYLSAADSPFAGLGLTQFYLEDFEDHLLNVPGVTSNGASVQGAGSLIDSVDGDDGTVDGVCAKAGSCDDWFFAGGSTGVTYTFDATALGALPTHAGIVWTDGSGQVTFQARDANGLVVGQIGPVSDANFPDTSINGTVAEDRFFGIVYAGGIKSITISNSSGGCESDHLQYGR